MTRTRLGLLGLCAMALGLMAFVLLVLRLK